MLNSSAPWRWVALAALLLGLLLGYRLGKGDAPRPETVSAAPEIRQGDGSLVLAVEPAVGPSPAPHAIPRGAVEERQARVTVQPSREDCPPVTIDLSVIREDAVRRIVASSPDGTVIGGVDTPIERALVPQPLRPWAVGLSWEPRQERAGIWIERDVSRLRLGMDLHEAERGLEMRVRAGWRW